MNLVNEAARMFFALMALILTTVLTQPMTMNVSPSSSVVALRNEARKLPTFNNFNTAATRVTLTADNSVTPSDESATEQKLEHRRTTRQNMKIASLRPVYRSHAR